MSLNRGKDDWRVLSRYVEVIISRKSPATNTRGSLRLLHNEVGYTNKSQENYICYLVYKSLLNTEYFGDTRPPFSTGKKFYKKWGNVILDGASFHDVIKVRSYAHTVLKQINTSFLCNIQVSKEMKAPDHLKYNGSNHKNVE